MKTIHTLALTTLAAAMAAGTAFAQQPTTPPTGVPQTQQTPPQAEHGQTQAGMEARDHDKPSYDELDARGEGRVSRADLAAHPRLLEKFDDIDTAGDGTISRAEYDAWKSQKRDRDQATPQY